MVRRHLDHVVVFALALVALGAVGCQGEAGIDPSHIKTVKQAAGSPPSLTLPVNGTTLSGSSELFQWADNGTAVTDWWLYVGNGYGIGDYHDSGSLGSGVTSTTVNGLPLDGRTIYITLYYMEAGSWYALYYYVIASGTAPELTLPASGSTFTSSSQSFTWTPNTANVTEWKFYVGNGCASNDIYDSGSLLAGTLSTTATGLPTDGRGLCASLGYFESGIWTWLYYSFVAHGVVPEMTSPTNGSTLSGSTQTFTWTPNTATVTNWQLYVGNGYGSGDYYISSMHASGVLSDTVTGLPTDGRTIYVSLYWYYAGLWQGVYYSYVAHGTAPDLTSPASGSTFTSNSQTFTWTPNTAAVTEWKFYVGNGCGSADIYDAGALAGGTLSTTATGLPIDGRALCASLGYFESGIWTWLYYSFVAHLATLPALTSPANGSTFTSSSQSFTWADNGQPVTDWWLTVGSSAGGTDLYSSGALGAVTSQTVTGLPTDGRDLYVTLYYYETGTWTPLYYTFTASGSAPALTSPTAGITFTGSSETFTWSQNGTAVTEWVFYVGNSCGGNDIYDSGTLASGTTSATVGGLPIDGRAVCVTLGYSETGAWSYLYYSFTSFLGTLPALTSPANGSTFASANQSFTWVDNGQPVTDWWLTVGSSAGGTDLYTSGALGSVTSHAVTGLPTDGRDLYVTLYYYETGTWTPLYYTFVAWTLATPPAMTSPSQGSTLGGSSQFFSWTDNGTPVTEWWLYVGSFYASGNLYNSGSLGLNTSTTATGLPTDGRTLFVRLWYMQGGIWKTLDYTYKASGAPVLPSITSPAAGSTFSGSSATFTWTSNGATVCNWWVYAGRSQGTSNLFDGGSLPAATLTQTVTGLSTDGTTVWIRLWYGCSGVWQHIDVQYKAINLTTPTMASPTPGATLGGTSQLFTWTDNGWGSQMWWLYVGSTVGSSNYYNSGWINNPATLSRTATGLPTGGGTVWVRLWYKKTATAWLYKDMQYTAAP